MLDYTGIQLNPGDLVAVKPSGSSYGAYKLGTVMHVDTTINKVRVRYEEKKLYATDFNKICDASKFNPNRPENLTEPTFKFEVKYSYTTIDPLACIVVHQSSQLIDGKTYYISEYENRVINMNMYKKYESGSEA